MSPMLITLSQFALLALFLAVLLLAVTRMRSFKAAQDRLLASLDPATMGHWFRINLSRPKQNAWLHLLGFEAKGILVNLPDAVRVLAELPSGEKLDRTYRKGELGLRWFGNQGMSSGNLHWLVLGKGERELRICADTGLNAMGSRQATADMCRMIDPAYALPEAARHEFALERSPASLVTTGLLLAAMAFALADGLVLNPHHLVDTGHVLKGLPLVLLVPVPLFLWMANSRVPMREAMVLSLVLAGALMAAYVPALMRLDQALAPEHGSEIAFTLQDGGMLVPVEPGPPPLDYTRHRDYWAQYDAGSVHRFELVHGPLGMWQVDLGPMKRRMREFRRAQKRERAKG
jgi:hypothetical protein